MRKKEMHCCLYNNKNKQRTRKTKINKINKCRRCKSVITIAKCLSLVNTISNKVIIWSTILESHEHTRVLTHIYTHSHTTMEKNLNEMKYKITPSNMTFESINSVGERCKLQAYKQKQNLLLKVFV